MSYPFKLSPNVSAMTIMDALLEEARLLAANAAMLSSDAFEGFDDLDDETRRTILFGHYRQAETVLTLVKELSSPKYGLRTDAVLALRKKA